VLFEASTTSGSKFQEGNERVVCSGLFSFFCKRKKERKKKMRYERIRNEERKKKECVCVCTNKKAFLIFVHASNRCASHAKKHKMLIFFFPAFFFPSFAFFFFEQKKQAARKALSRKCDC
jgi:hypothetical protein